MKYNALSLMSRIREEANRLIINELAANGVPELAPSHGDILAALYNKEPMSMNEIAEKIHRTRATTTVLVQKLEKIGFVKKGKNTNDNRYTNVILTSYGRNFKDMFDKISTKLNNTIYKNLTKQESEILENLLEKIQSSL